jgi:acetyl esterase/lipase
MNRFIIVTLCSVFLLSAVGSAAEISQKEYVFKTIGERQLKLYVDFPADWTATDQRPVIVFFFGGGWVNGSVAAPTSECSWPCTTRARTWSWSQKPSW